MFQKVKNKDFAPGSFPCSIPVSRCCSTKTPSHSILVTRQLLKMFQRGGEQDNRALDFILLTSGLNTLADSVSRDGQMGYSTSSFSILVSKQLSEAASFSSIPFSRHFLCARFVVAKKNRTFELGQSPLSPPLQSSFQDTC